MPYRRLVHLRCAAMWRLRRERPVPLAVQISSFSAQASSPAAYVLTMFVFFW